MFPAVVAEIFIVLRPGQRQLQRAGGYTSGSQPSYGLVPPCIAGGVDVLGRDDSSTLERFGPLRVPSASTCGTRSDGEIIGVRLHRIPYALAKKNGVWTFHPDGEELGFRAVGESKTVGLAALGI